MWGLKKRPYQDPKKTKHYFSGMSSHTIWELGTLLFSYLRPGKLTRFNQIMLRDRCLLNTEQIFHPVILFWDTWRVTRPSSNLTWREINHECRHVLVEIWFISSYLFLLAVNVTVDAWSSPCGMHILGTLAYWRQRSCLSNFNHMKWTHHGLNLLKDTLPQSMAQ